MRGMDVGVLSCKARNTITSILYSMRYFTGGQWSCCNAAVMLRRSPRMIRRTTLAAERCNISRTTLGPSCSKVRQHSGVSGVHSTNDTQGIILAETQHKRVMDIRFDGKRALVTGAGKGIGRGIAVALLAGGADTYALSRTQEDLDKLEAEHPSIHTVCVDLSDWAATRKAVEELGPIDLLVNNAAVYIPVSFFETDEAVLDKTFAVNIKAVTNVSQIVAKGMVERGKGGAIVHISSSGSNTGSTNRLPYSVSKGALDQVMRVMALELGPHQIRVNCVNPTVTKTSMSTGTWEDPAKASAFIARTPQGKFAEVKDIVHPVLYLLSDKADMINGVTLVVDGGKLVT